MRKIIFFIFISLQVFLPGVSYSQYDQEDTVFATPGYDEDDDEYTDTEAAQYFNAKPPAQKIRERRIDEQKISSIKSEDAYWYADLAPQKEKPKSTTKKNFDFNIPEALFWFLVIGAGIALIVWFLLNNQISLFRKSRIDNPSESPEEFQEEDIFSIKYDQEIRRAIDAGNYRVAVRLLYLQTLKELTERNMIRYGHEKTNSDYLFRLYKTRYYDRFFRLTRHFDYTWYGGFDLDENSFRIVQSDFIQFKQQLA